MPDFRVDIDSFGEELVSRQLESRAAAVLNMEDTFRRVADYIRRVNEHQFDTEGSLSGGRDALDPDTMYLKAKRNHDPRILHATLRLRESLTEEGHPDQIVLITAHQLHFGSDVPYGEFHRTGTFSMPDRRPMDFSRGRRNQIVRIMKDGILGRTR